MSSVPVSLCVFDAYGTLFNVHSAVQRHAAKLGPQADALSQLWRTKQLEYSWVRSLMRRHADFWKCTTDALDFAFGVFRIGDEELRENLLDAYRRLDAYPEVIAVLTELRTMGVKTAVLSNGSPGMLTHAVESAGLAKLLDASISIEEAGIFKPDPRVYRLATDRFGVEADAVSFQSSNAWDIAGANAFGFRTIWINRSGQPAEYGIGEVARIVASLAAVAGIVTARAE